MQKRGLENSIEKEKIKQKFKNLVKIIKIVKTAIGEKQFGEWLRKRRCYQKSTLG